MGMAKGDERRKSFWDDDEEEVSAKEANNPKIKPSGTLDSAVVDQKVQDTRLLMDQTHALYQHYFNGIERRPPIEKRLLLESKVNELQRIGGSTTAIKFKVSQFIQLYTTFREMWDRKLRDMERK